jgi:glycerol-3-phosphate dehydrogenase (NAD(P)+)
MNKACVLGAGSWGSALAMVLSENFEEVYLWTRNEEHAEEINSNRTNIKYLKNVEISENIYATTNLEDAITNSEIIVLGVPSQAIRGISREIKHLINENQILVNVAKGLEKETGYRMSEVVLSEIKNAKYCVLSGPSHAEEVAIKIPTTVVVSSLYEESMNKVQDAFMTNSFRVYTNPDLIGVELGGTLKNIIALGCGIVSGVGYGDNTTAALITRGLSEMKTIGVNLGAKEETFGGLSGTGDLIVTCTSKHSRNRKAGELIGMGLTKDEAVKKVEMVVEGIIATESVFNKVKNMNIQTPILSEMHKILFENKKPIEAIYQLMNRDKKSEL